LQQLQPGWAFVDTRLLLLQEHPVLRQLYFWIKKKGIYFPKTPGIRIISTGRWMPLWQRTITFRSLLQAEPVEVAAVTAADRDFLITYTSGTTSMPKGVVHSLSAITESILRIAELIQGGHNKRIATHLPYFALIGLNAGVTAYLWDYHSTAEAKRTFIETHQITTLFSPPCDYLPFIELCEAEGSLFPSCLQHLFFGSAPVHRSFLERLIAVLPAHVQLTCLYGMTENLVVTSIDGRLKALLPTEAGDILGTPVAGVALDFAPDGEIMVQSPQLYQRYLHESDRNAWHASGDLGHLDAAGRLVLTGRKKDMIIRRNFNLYPGLYEPTINRIPGVTECAFVGVYDPHKHDEVVALFVETHLPIPQKAIQNALQQGPFSIDQEALPDKIFLQTLPRAGRQNKVDKNALRQQLASTLHG
jgi:acyl-CoA synthetase (AMP-forming)/AMP-acid ligase II